MLSSPQSCLFVHLIFELFETGLLKQQTFRNIHICTKYMFDSGQYFSVPFTETNFTFSQTDKFLGSVIVMSNHTLESSNALLSSFMLILCSSIHQFVLSRSRSIESLCSFVKWYYANCSSCQQFINFQYWPIDVMVTHCLISTVKL